MRGADRRRARRPGAVALALLFVTAAAALALTLYYHLGVPGVVAVVVAFLIALPALYLGWVPLKGARQPPDRNLAQIADELAARLRSQWADEAEARGLNDPYPLPVSWTAADPPLAGDLDALKTLATSGAGWSARGRKNWAKGPEDLAGGGDRKLADVLAAVPTGRLVLLGEPGAGKTMLMVGLVLDLLARRRRGDPIPVLATLASWDPVSLGLHAWLGATLITSYPALAAAAPPGSAGGNRFEALVEARLILPVLDGLDELPESARPTAITRINKELKSGEQVVVTCRTGQYRAAVSPQDGQGAALRAAAVQLSTLPFGDVASYLRTDAGPAAEGRWDFLGSLSAGSPAWQALGTPLMAGLARAIYNPRPGEHAGKLPEPSELCGLADRPAVEAHLFDAFIRAAYRPPTAGRWTAERAEKWLSFLARHLEQTIGSPDLAWWQLRLALWADIVWVLLVVGPLAVAAAAAWVAIVIWTWVVIGTWAGITTTIGTVAAIGSAAKSVRRESPKPVRGARAGRKEGELPRPVRGVRLRPPSLRNIVWGVGVGALVGFSTGPAWPGNLPSAVLAVPAGVAAGAVNWVFNQKGAPLDLSSTVNPLAVLAGDRRIGTAFGLVFGIATVTVLGAMLWVGHAIGTGVGAAAGAGAVVGVVSIFSRSAWPYYEIARIWLALRRRLPWRLMGFLADAHGRGVLRQAGAVYQFRHLELQQRLAPRP